MSFVPEDALARDETRRSRGVSLVVAAGAGTGKTTLLVDRITSLVRSGDARLLEIAAVTFTENAAATMKLRLRERLERIRLDATVPQAERARAGEALDVLERAQVSTIHALCAALLQEQPLECGVVPGFRVADETQAEALFAASWDEWLAARLDAGDPILAEALRQDIPLEGRFEDAERSSLRGFARTLLWERDLAPLVAGTAIDATAWRRELLERSAEIRRLREAAISGDTLGDQLAAYLPAVEPCRFLEGDALVQWLLKLPKGPRKDLGRRSNWRTGEELTRAREIAAWLGEAPDRWRAELGARLHGELVRALQGVLACYEERKRREGVLDFVDLLVKTRDALRDRADVRRRVRDRIRHLVIDEFQDTDPLQVQIAELIAGGEPGRLVVVGDAKQSIYRFRRADVALFRRLLEEARGRQGHAVLALTQNFRSRPAILRFVNRAFADLIAFSAESDQPVYEAIAARPGLGDEPSVIALRFTAPELADRGQLLEAEAAATAALVAQAARGGFEVRDPGTDAPRRSRAGDVMVLAPRLTQIRHLEDALDRHDVAYAVDGGKSFFNRQEVHETLAALRAIDDPMDRTALVAALRSSFFGVSDRDLVQYALAGGRLLLSKTPQRDLPGGAVVAPALVVLERLHRERLAVSVPALLERLYDETRVLAALAGTRRGASRAANLEKVVALARRGRDLGTLTLRGFVRLLAQRIEYGSEEPDLPSTRPGDHDTVRILSIHKAKGLEAPIVVLHDTAASLQTDADVIALWEEGRVAIGFRAGCRPPEWKTLAERDKARARAEGRRLLYVACTRARDLLVVPQPPADAQGGDFWRDLMRYLAPSADVAVVDATTLRVAESAAERVDPRVLAAAEGGDAVAARWDAERARVIAAAAERGPVPIPALRVAERTAPPAAPATGPGGRDFGGLVHRILEWVPFDQATPERVAATAHGLAPGFGLDDDAAARAADAATRALSLPVMQRARRATRVWRELPLRFVDEDDLVEGVVDLVFEEGGELVVVDYKTDHISAGQALDQAAHHAPQLRLYGRGLTLATGLHVRERVVLFTTLGQTVAV